MILAIGKEFVMAAPYFLMVFLYLALAGMAVLDTALVNFHLLPKLPNLRWLITHLVVLGALTEFVFGALPMLAAARARRPKPAFRWETWLLLNTGIVVLLVGVTQMNFLFITTGGTLVFLAVVRLARQLVQLRPVHAPPETAGPGGSLAGRLINNNSLKFYLAGLAYLLTGILVGAGLWQGWSTPLRIAIPKEVHVHANLWGFTALVFAGLLIDLSPRFTGGKFARPQWVLGIFWLMSLGALGLVLGPWLDIDLLQVFGLTLHTAGSLLLVGGAFRSVRMEWRSWSPGLWHLLAAYVWFFLPVVVAPLVVVQMGVGTEVAGSGGPILIFGWILQFSYAVIPLLLREMTHSGSTLRPGGSWLSLATANAGSLIYWASLFIPVNQEPLRGVAFLLWTVSLLPILSEIVSIFKATQRLWSENSDLSR
jgi:hypothetical protein